MFLIILTPNTWILRKYSNTLYLNTSKEYLIALANEMHDGTKVIWKKSDSFEKIRFSAEKSEMNSKFEKKKTFHYFVELVETNPLMQL